MRWLNTKDLRSTLTAIFTVSTVPPSTPEDHAAALENIRCRMLELATPQEGERPERLIRRIRYATNVESLWFARGELMAQLAREFGEMVAREKVEGLNGAFKRLLPRGLRSRPSPLDECYRSSRPGED